MKKTNFTLVSEIAKGSNRSIRTLTNRSTKSITPEERLDALYYLALCHLKGIHTLCDKQKALQLLEQAAHNRHAHARFSLGLLYIQGNFVKSNKSQGLKLIELAAMAGQVDAMAYIGSLYIKGHTYSIDIKKGLELTILAHEQGSSKATYNLAICYQKGIGATKNKIKAVQLFKKAADNGHTGAQHSLALYAFKNKESTIGINRLIEAANTGYKPASHDLACCYYSGTHTAQNYANAYIYFNIAESTVPEHLNHWLKTSGQGFKIYLNQEIESITSLQTALFH
ncbi:MAG: TPR repeat protein [Alphaproteobacteria bacterium]|jgi:TPR repeat protein